jgi:transcriptional regulator with XRE-family HTH domain
VGRHRIHVSRFDTGYRGVPPNTHAYHTEWGTIVGDRVRRLRQGRGWFLKDLAFRVQRPEGGHYSLGYFSKLERGWSAAPLYAYLAVADVLEVPPGILLGADEALKEVPADQRVVLDFLKAAGITPAEALARLAGREGKTSSNPQI